MTANNLPPRLYYRLDEAAQLLGCTERDLIHLGAQGKILIAANLPIQTACGACAIPIEMAGGDLDALTLIDGRTRFDAPDYIGDIIRAGHFEAAVSGLALANAPVIEDIELHGAARHGLFRWIVWEHSADRHILERVVVIGFVNSTLLRQSDLFITDDQIQQLKLYLAGSHSAEITPSTIQAKPRATTKTLNQQRAFAEQLGQLFGRAVSADDSREPMTIVMELLESSKYAHMIHSPYALHSALVQETRNKRTKQPEVGDLEVGGDALARWLKKQQ